MFVINIGDTFSRNFIINKLVDMTYERNELDFHRGTFRVRGNSIDIVPINEKSEAIRIDLDDDKVESITIFDPLTGSVLKRKQTVIISPASLFVTSKETLEKAVANIKKELDERLKELHENGKLIEEQRLKERTNYDMEMLLETGFCNGIENYSRHLSLKEAGETPTTLMDFFPKDYLLVIDESHVTIPQVRAMYNGDRMRKQTLVDYGFRLPSALDNRPLKFEEFEKEINQIICVSATPGDYELDKVDNHVVEQIIRPTGLLDPEVEIRPTLGQIDDLCSEIDERVSQNERVLITTLTVKMAEELTKHLQLNMYKVAYLHHETCYTRECTPDIALI